MPKSCCEEHDGITDVDECQKDPEKFIEQSPGCLQKFKDSIESNSKNILAVGVTIVVIMVMSKMAKLKIFLALTRQGLHDQLFVF